MILKTTAKFPRETFEFLLNTDKFDRNYDDEPYAYWIGEQGNWVFEINILKTQEVNGNLTNEGYVKRYMNIKAFDEDKPLDTADVTFIALQEVEWPNNLK